MMIVLIGGHGGSYSGCVHSNVIEREVNHNIIDVCCDEMKKHTDKFIRLNKRDQTINVNDRANQLKLLTNKYGKIDVHSVHCDSYIDKKARGITLYLSLFNTENRDNYKKFMSKYSSNFDIPIRGIFTRSYNNNNYYAIHRKSGEKSIVKLWEMGFLSNDLDRDHIVNNIDEIGIMLARFILKQNNIDLKQSIYYRVQAGYFKDKVNAENMLKSLDKLGIKAIIKEEKAI